MTYYKRTNWKCRCCRKPAFTKDGKGPLCFECWDEKKVNDTAEHANPVVVAAPLFFYAKCSGYGAIGPFRDDASKATGDLTQMASIIDGCPKHQEFAALQACMSVRS